MIYEHLFRRAGEQKVRAALIGTGSYGVSLLFQLRLTPRAIPTVVCDRSLPAARDACRKADIPAQEITECATTDEVASAVRAGLIALVEDPALAIQGPCDVVVECTGSPEAGAAHAAMAIEAGRHVAMVSKEPDSVVGPVLAHRAAEAGVVYTPVDGDQHGLLTGIVLWARTLGYRVIAGGKARESDFIYDDEQGVVRYHQREVRLDSRGIEALARIEPGEDPEEKVARRREALEGLPFLMPADVCEMVIAANHTGLMADRPELWSPALRTNEVPGVFCPRDLGGVLQREGVIDVFGCLRRADEAGQMGGEFIVVAMENVAAREFLGGKGLVMNDAGTAAMIYRPLHLLGCETPISILCAALLGLPTGGIDVMPKAELAGRARGDVAEGTVLDPDTIHDGKLLQPIMLEAQAITETSPAPLYLAQSCRLRRPVTAGTVLTIGDLEEPPDSRLWALRREQDRLFLGASS